ncbi:MAG TPA: acyloxyacyl hydrolase [Candidatus Eisenbacteria bacterium]|jgi:hypothetical protein
MARALAALVFLVSFVFLSPRPCAAEDSPPLPVWHVGPYFGMARNSPGGDKWGAIADRDHYFLGVRASAPVLRWGGLSLAFAPEIVPVLVITNNPTYRTVTEIRDGTEHQTQVADGSAPVFGAGFAPLGTEALVRVDPRIQAFAAMAVGVVWFTREVPVANSKSYNYTVELGGGLLWECRPPHRLRIGYMFHHLSNGWSAVENPGLDGDVFYVGWETALGPAAWGRAPRDE